MNLKKIWHIGLSLMMLGGVATSCQNSFDEPGLTVPEATMKPNTTIAELKQAFMETNATLCPVKDEATQEHYIISGRVISSDATGNIYQSLMVQDATGAMPITIRRASLYNEYHLGQEVVIDVTGLWIGRYNNLMQLGWLGEPYNGVDQLTFMSFAEFQAHTQLNGNPNVSTRFVDLNGQRPENSMYCISLDIDQLADVAALSEECVMLQGQLVEFNNVHFIGGGEETYAPYQETVNRYIQGENSQMQIVVRNSGYSTFYNDILPEGTGRVRGILSWYGDGAANSSQPYVVQGWQLLLRSVDDVIFDNKGSLSEPYSIQEVLGYESNGISAWAEGYIVGSLDYDGNPVFGANGNNADTNLLVADTPDQTDKNLCVTVALPAGSDFRAYANLLDHPENYKKTIKVYGRFSDYMVNDDAVPGIIGNPGTPAYFQIEGVVIKGTEDSPYDVQYVIDNYSSGEADVWSEGYIVGFVAGADYGTGVTFGLPGAGANYSNSNVVLAPTADTTDPAKCITVRLTSAARRTLGLGYAPQVLGHKLLVKGSLEMYLNRAGVNMSDYVLK